MMYVLNHIQVVTVAKVGIEHEDAVYLALVKLWARVILILDATSPDW